jgi:hypothetical protein
MANTRKISIKNLREDVPLVAEWIRRGIVLPPYGKKTPLPKSPISLANGTARRILRLSRIDSRV